MQSVQLQIHREFHGIGKELHDCVDNSGRVMPVRSAVRAGAATVHCEYEKERKHHVRGTATSHMRHRILGTSKVGLKKMNDDFDVLLSHYEFVLLALREVESVQNKSKKPHRLSATSSDLLD